MTSFQQKQLDLMRQMEAAVQSNPSASTLVSMRQDYVNDPSRCLTCVSFVPTNIANTIIHDVIEPLQQLEPHFYYFPLPSLHITIQNIRVSEYPLHFGPTDIAKAKELLSNNIGQNGPFSFTYKGLLSMPTSVSLIALVKTEYDQFVKSLRAKLIVAGIPDDKKYFTDEIVFANTTICRYTHKPSTKFLEKLETFKDVSIGDVEIKNVSLVTMNAGAHPSTIDILETYPFRQI